MNRAMKWGIAALAAAFVAGAVPTLKTSEGPQLGDEDRPSLAQMNTGKVQRLFQQWRDQHESTGGDRNVLLGLGFTRGMSAEFTSARGAARLDLLGGRVAVSVEQLQSDRIADVWLIDNQPGPGRSAMPDRGDAMKYVGALEREDDRGTLLVELGEDAFADFEVDMVVVTLGGMDPVEGGVLYGSPSTFQRLYTMERRGQIQAYAAASELLRGPQPSLFQVGPDMAWADTIVVDADVLLDPLIAEGADLFINEGFDGNGRTCATCHPANNSFTIDPTFIAGLKDDDALFVSERAGNGEPGLDPSLALLERDALLRGRGTILENLDGFGADGLGLNGLNRGVPHTLALSTSLSQVFNIFDPGTALPFDNTSPAASGFAPIVLGTPPLFLDEDDVVGIPVLDPGPPKVFTFPLQRTGWGGDGAPNGGALRDFATGAVIQHFPTAIPRCFPGDPSCTATFRLPTDTELDAMEAFQLALGRDSDIDLASMQFRDPTVAQGAVVFNTLDTAGGTVEAGKCALCHENAGANMNSDAFLGIFGLPAGGNANFGTGVNDNAGQPNDLFGESNPRDGGFGVIPHDGVNCVPATGGFGAVTQPGGPLPAGLCEEDFNVPPIVEAADTGPFFHSNTVDTIEAAVAFYNDDAFNDSAGGQLAASADTGGIGIRIDATSVQQIANMLRVVNALENLRSARDLGQGAFDTDDNSDAGDLIRLAIEEGRDAIDVLSCAGLHPEAVRQIEKAIDDAKSADAALLDSTRRFFLGEADEHVQNAIDDMIVSSS